MKLDDFIATSLKEIFAGIKDAQHHLHGQGPGTGMINPKWGTANDHAKYMSEISFDIALSVANSASGGGGAGLKVLSVDIGAKGEVKHDSGSVSRIAFKIPVAFPAITVTDVAPSGG